MSDLLVFLIQLQSVFDAHAWLAQILIVVIFTAISLIAWFVFRKKNRNSRDYHKYLWRLFWQISSPVILWSIFILSSTQLLRIVANEFMPSLSGIIGDIRLFAVIWVMVRGIFKYLNSVEKVQIMHGKDSTTVSAITKLSKFSVLLLFSLIIADYFGVSFSGLLAFGGTGAIIIGLAGKDILSNFFSGLMIYIDRPFNVGDWVSSPDRNIEGTVQSIGWRLTKIFTFDNRPLYVPNSVFSNISVENPGRMTNRRITATIGLRYEDAEKMDDVVNAVRSYLQQHDAIDQTQDLLVSFNEFGASSLNFSIYCFTKTSDWAEWLAIQQQIFLRIIALIKEQGAALAYPGETVFLQSVPLNRPGNAGSGSSNGGVSSVTLKS